MVNIEIRLIIFFAVKDGEALYSQQKQGQELTVAQVMKSLLPNSDKLKKVEKTTRPFRYDLQVVIFKNVFVTNYKKFTHSSTLAWRTPWMEEPSRLQSMGSLRVGHDWATSLSLFTFMHWRRKWQPTPVFFPGESQGWRNLVGCRLWGHTESDTTEAT